MTKLSMMSGATRRMLLAGAIFFSLANSALALDGADLLAKINAVRQLKEDRFVADSIAVVGTTVTMTGVRLVRAESGKEPLSMGLVTMVGVKEEPDGYRIGKIFFNDIDESRGGETFSARDMVMTGLFVPNVSKPDTLDSMFNFDRFTGGPMRYTMSGKEMFRISGFAINFDVTEDRNALGFDGRISDIFLDLTGVTDPDPRETIDGLGLQQLNGNIAIDGAWLLDTGQIFQKYSVDIDNVGSLSVDFSFGGYRIGFEDKISKALDEAKKNPDQAAGRQAMMASLMHYARDLTFESASIRFIDDGITARLLAFKAKNRGISVQEMVSRMKSATPAMLARLKTPMLEKQIETAFGAFLDNPRNLRLSAIPAKPLPVPLVIGAAMGDGTNFVKTVNLQFVANEPAETE